LPYWHSQPLPSQAPLLPKIIAIPIKAYVVRDVLHQGGRRSENILLLGLGDIPNSHLITLLLLRIQITSSFSFPFEGAFSQGELVEHELATKVLERVLVASLAIIRFSFSFCNLRSLAID
jgi:hypothetical protein